MCVTCVRTIAFQRNNCSAVDRTSMSVRPPCDAHTHLSLPLAGHAALARCWRRHNGNLLIRPSVNTRTTLLAYTRVARTFTLIVTHDLDTEISHGRARPVDDQLGITRILYAKKRLKVSWFKRWGGNKLIDGLHIFPAEALGNKKLVLTTLNTFTTCH